MTDPRSRDSILPLFDDPPVSARGEHSRALLARLADEHGADDDFVPGTQAPPDVADVDESEAAAQDDLAGLAEQLESFGTNEASALSQGRAFAISSRLWARVGQVEQAREAAREAARRAPRLASVGALYRNQSPAIDEPETRHKHLEAAARLAAHPASRTHAALELADALRESGDETRALALLDHAARTGSLDPRVGLGRILLRLSSGQNTLGVEAPEALARAAHRAVEILGGRSSNERARHLELLRVVRSLERGDVVQAAEVLAKQAEPALRELGAALFSSKAEERPRARAILRELATRSPSRSVLRTVALQAVEAHDWPALCEVLSAADPASGTFSLSEQMVLRLVMGEVPMLRGEELEQLARSSRELCLALAPFDAPQNLDFGSRAADARLGALLPRLGGDATAGLAELHALGGDHGAAWTAALLRLDLELEAGNAEGASEILSELGRRSDDPSFELLAGVVLERAGKNEPARARYEQLLAHPDLGLTALRGLVGIDPSLERAELLRDAARTSGDAERRADALLEAALVDEPSERPASILAAAESFQDPALLLAAASLAEATGNSTILGEALRRLVESDDQVMARFSRLRWAFELREAAPREAAALLESADIEPGLDSTVAWARRWLDADDAEPLAPSLSTSAWELSQAAARSLFAGDDERAFSQLRALLAKRASEAARGLLEEMAEERGDVARLSERWLESAKSEDSATRGYAYERLAELDELRGDRSGALLWLRSAADEMPEALSVWIKLEDALLFDGRFEEWPFVQAKLQELLAPGDRQAYASVAGAFALGDLDLREARRRLEPLLTLERPPLLALRTHLSFAKERGEDQRVSELAELLSARASSDLDRATLLLDVAYASARLGQEERARDFTGQALAVRSDLFATRLLQTRLVSAEDAAGQAAALQSLASASSVPRHQAAFLLDAGQLWLELEDTERAKGCFRSALEAEPASRAAFDELSELYLSAGELDDLSALLQVRLERTSQPAEKLDLELRVAQIELELERPDKARTHLERALELAPLHAGALRAHAGVCESLGDHRATESSWVRLLGELQGPKHTVERTAVLRTLGALYENELDDLERAMDAYEAVLALAPDRTIEARLVGVFARLGLGERASQLQTQLIQSAVSDDEKRKGALTLAELYEGIGRDPKRALATLERAHKAWPLDGEVLEATALFLDRTGDQATRRVLVDRVGKEARRALEDARWNAALFDTLARVSRLSDVPSQAEATLAARAAFLGDESHLRGAFVQALDPALDELFAPAVLSGPLRNLLRRAGAVLDTAFSIDLSALGAQRASPGPALERLSAFARGLGVPVPEVFVANALGSRCQLLTSAPLRFLVGPGLDALDTTACDYQIARAFKLQQLGAAALARSRPEDAWPMLAALLLLFAPQWRPRGVDARKVAQARALVEQGLARVGYDDDVPILALEAIGALGEQGASVGEAARTLALRSALLAVGDPGAGLRAMSAGADKPLPPSGPSRFRWLEGHPEAKELLLFAVSDELARARERLGLAEVRTQRAPLPPRATSLGPMPPPRRG